MDESRDRETAAGVALADLAFVEVQTPEDFAERVLSAIDAGAAARRRAARMAVIRVRERAWETGRRGADETVGWLRRHRVPLRTGALASSALVVGAVAVGLEARHARRSRGMRGTA